MDHLFTTKPQPGELDHYAGRTDQPPEKTVVISGCRDTTSRTKRFVKVVSTLHIVSPDKASCVKARW